jgi:hypothetical protein
MTDRTGLAELSCAHDGGVPRTVARHRPDGLRHRDPNLHRGLVSLGRHQILSDAHPTRGAAIVDLLRAAPCIVRDRVRDSARLGVSHGTELGHVIQSACSLNLSPVVLGDYRVLGVAEADREP